MVYILVLMSYCETETTYLHDFPPSSELIIKVLLNSAYHRDILALLDLVFRANNDFSRLGVAEEEHLLGRERDHKDRDIIVHDFSIRHLSRVAQVN